MTRRAAGLPTGQVVLAALLAASAAHALGPGEAVAEIARACWFARVAGEVQIERGDATRAAYAGLVVAADDRIVAEPDGRAAVACSDGVEFTVGGGTEIDVRDFPTGDVSGGVVLDLIEGLVRVLAPPTGDWSGFSVRTPQAIASVRSTDWVTISGTDKSSVFVVDGIVAVTDPEVRVETELSPGEGVDVAAGRIIDGPKRWGDGRIAETMARLAFP